jgi:vacuolar-type H+-ATPase subunit H
MNGFLDKAKKLLDEHDDKVDQALDKVREKIDENAKNQYSEPLDKAVQFAKDRTGEGDTTR